MFREISLVGQTPSSAPDPLVRLFHDAQDRPTRASAADQGVCPTMRIYSMNYGDKAPFSKSMIPLVGGLRY
jgi:hypothetical protein